MRFYLKTILFVFLNFSIIQGNNLCPPSFCGNSILKVEYPFKLQSHTPPSNNCTYFNLNCNQSSTVVNLPHGGDFYVSNIDYVDGFIQLYDPENCLMKRIMNYSLESSPFKANYYDNYTFYVCPSNSTIFQYLNPIDCLSNSTYKTIATTDYDGDLTDDYRCGRIGNWLLPVRYYRSYDETVMFLSWDATTACQACQESVDDHQPPPSEPGPKPIDKIITVVMSMPALILMAFSCCSVFCLHLVKMIRNKYEGDSAAAAAAPTTAVAVAMPPGSATGLDEFKIKACTELVVLNRHGEGIPNGNSNTCSICLENYDKKEKVSVISKCGHCFHATCIKQWLGKNGTCPVCRTSLSDIAL